MRDGDTTNNAFLYTGQSREEIPGDITHVKMDPSVKEIHEGAFNECGQLINVELCEGLERIKSQAFENCRSLQCIVIPSTVKVIGEDAFHGFRQLINVELNEGLERIDDRAFEYCTSLQRIVIPSTVKVIELQAFQYRNQLRNVELRKGLERIDPCSSIAQRCQSSSPCPRPMRL
jgi:hypothetical protein